MRLAGGLLTMSWSSEAESTSVSSFWLGAVTLDVGFSSSPEASEESDEAEDDALDK